MIISINKSNKPKRETKEKIKISFFIACANRIEHLKQTLPYNLEQLEDINDIEFIILNYNSQDDMNEFMKKFTKEMNTEKLVYYKETFSKEFHLSHAMNMAARLCSGEIICPTNADYFVDMEWYNFILENMKKNVFICSKSNNDSNGRCCFWKNDFTTLRGFDELMTGWGWEEGDLYRRANSIGLYEINLKDKPQFWKHISHPWTIRQKNNYKNNGRIEKNRGSNIVNPQGFGKGCILEKNFKKINIIL